MSTLRDDLAALRRALDAADAAGDADASAIAELRSRCASVVASSAPSARAKISADEMSAEVVDSNPYSRLMALLLLLSQMTLQPGAQMLHLSGHWSAEYASKHPDTCHQTSWIAHGTGQHISSSVLVST